MTDSIRLQTLLNSDSYWLKSQNNGIIISSRIRLARNLAKFPFVRTAPDC